MLRTFCYYSSGENKLLLPLHDTFPKLSLLKTIVTGPPARRLAHHYAEHLCSGQLPFLLAQLFASGESVCRVHLAGNVLERQRRLIKTCVLHILHRSVQRVDPTAALGEGTRRRLRVSEHRQRARGTGREEVPQCSRNRLCLCPGGHLLGPEGVLPLFGGIEDLARAPIPEERSPPPCRSISDEDVVAVPCWHLGDYVDPRVGQRLFDPSADDLHFRWAAAVLGGQDGRVALHETRNPRVLPERVVVPPRGCARHLQREEQDAEHRQEVLVRELPPPEVVEEQRQLPQGLQSDSDLLEDVVEVDAEEFAILNYKFADGSAHVRGVGVELVQGRADGSRTHDKVRGRSDEQLRVVCDEANVVDVRRNVHRGVVRE
eukprot:PhM_4_TR1256/c2_g1_i1/m.81168